MDFKETDWSYKKTRPHGPGALTEYLYVTTDEGERASYHWIDFEFDFSGS